MTTTFLAALRLRACLALGVCGAALASASAAVGNGQCAPAQLPISKDCERLDAGTVIAMPVGTNTETAESEPGGDFGAIGFSISIEGEPFDGGPPPKTPNLPRDLALERANVQVTYDGLGPLSRLNVRTDNLRRFYSPGETIRFHAYSNYPAFITHAEVRVLNGRGRLITSIPVEPNGVARWAMPEDGPSELTYVLRVHDERGRFNETAPLALVRSYDVHSDAPTIPAAGEGEDRTLRTGFRPDGGAVTVSGESKASSRISIMRETVPVDENGRFVVQRILPHGDHLVDVELPSGRRFVREVTIPKQEGFHVALVDLTFGRRFEDEAEQAAGTFEKTYADGRFAYYVTRRVRGGYRITSSLDTGEGPLEDVFERLDEKDPRAVLNRLDPDDFYPVYGDDSTAYDATPTKGRFYVRIEKDENAFVWGDFNPEIGEWTYLANRRELYGAQLTFGSAATTRSGEPRVSGSVYAATPDMLPQRDVLRGTGGSAYFLSRQDIHGGSEQVMVEVRDLDTGRTLERRVLARDDDYRIDYVQGLVILDRQLSSIAADGGVIRDAPIGEDVVNLIVQYEYTPAAGDLSGASTGGELQFRVTDRLRFGARAMREATGIADQTMYGVDLEYKIGSNSLVEAEIAETQGPGFGRTLSLDGGLTLDEEASSGTVGTKARAYRFSADLDLGDLGSTLVGELGFYFERKEKGFSSFNENVDETQRVIGAYGRVELSDRATLSFEAEDFEKQGGDRKTSAEVDLSYQLSKPWVLDAGVGWLDQTRVGIPAETGSRTDVALRLTYQPHDDLSLYGFVQGTLARDGAISANDRVGVGGSYRFADHWEVEAEASDGTLGEAARLRLIYNPTEGEETYLGYTVNPDAGNEYAGERGTTFVIGGRRSVTDRTKLITESTYNTHQDQSSLARSFGVSYTPDDRWTLTGSAEIGSVSETDGSAFDRHALSFGVDFRDGDQRSGRFRLEFRNEDGDGLERDRETWLLSAAYSHKTSESWRFLAEVDALISRSAEGSFRDGEYVEANLGFAYRPVDNDRTNALFRLTYLQDLPGEDQRSADGDTDGPKQRSLIFSADVTHDLNKHWTVGAKYGYRKSEVAARGSDEFSPSTAHLAILRVDWHVVHRWDISVEGRMLKSEEVDAVEAGALIGVYRHINNNIKLGIGYEIGQVSDDLRDQTYKSRGVFLNLVAKF